MYKYKGDLASNNLKWLICPKTNPNQTIKKLIILEADTIKQRKSKKGIPTPDQKKKNMKTSRNQVLSKKFNQKNKYLRYFFRKIF